MNQIKRFNISENNGTLKMGQKKVSTSIFGKRSLGHLLLHYKKKQRANIEFRLSFPKLIQTNLIRNGQTNNYITTLTNDNCTKHKKKQHAHLGTSPYFISSMSIVTNYR